MSRSNRNDTGRRRRSRPTSRGPGRGRRGRRHIPADLTTYEGCAGEADLGLLPLAVGWLRRDEPFNRGPLPAAFWERLLAFCQEPFTVCRSGRRPVCRLAEHPVQSLPAGDQVIQPGAAEIRVIGEEAIFAASTLILHYIHEHSYRPPEVFVRAVLHGPDPGSPEHRALIRALRG